MPNVQFTRKELKTLLPIYDVVSDCCDGDFKVKSKRTKYLPQPNPTDLSSENQERYKQYVARAIFYNVTKNTYSGLIGQIFSKETQIELPASLEFLKVDADGTGKGIEQVSKEGVGNLLKGARFGLLSDYPKTDGTLTKSEIEQGNIKPTIKLYKSEDIINWRTKLIGSEVVYSLIVLREKVIYDDDGFEFKERWQYRDLRLNEENIYVVTIYYTNSEIPNAQSVFQIIDSFIPSGFDGSPLNKIPFEFCGSDNNDAEPDIPVLYDIAILNIGHYRNSADYEESSFITGQPTPYFAGLTEAWVKDVLKGTIQLGARGAVPLPDGGSAGLLQAQANTMPFEAMKHKEEQFIALGAKLVSPNGGTKTATEAQISNTTETSILSTLAVNASKAFENSIKHCLKFVSNNESDESKIIFKLNTDFEIAKMTPAERNQTLNEWMKGAISWQECRNNLRKGKVELEEDIKAREEIDTEIADANAMAIDQANAIAPDTNIPSVGK